jgi:antitoxin (DNA-binding transcriptional repressor) of toxin-antitoxin stability system
MAEMPSEVANNRRVVIKGVNAGDSVEVTILNAVTADLIGITEAEDDGTFKFDERYRSKNLPPCVVYAEYTDNTGETYAGPSLAVTNKRTGEPIANCIGLPVDLTESLDINML